MTPEKWLHEPRFFRYICDNGAAADAMMLATSAAGSGEKTIQLLREQYDIAAIPRERN
jgi:hypothetical protein